MKQFNKTYKIGRTGELITIDFLTKHGYEIIDDSNKHLGYDIIANGTLIEIKTDLKAGYTGNIFIETGLINQRGKILDGWLDTIEAKYIWYNIPKLNTALIIDVEELRALMNTTHPYRYYCGESPYNKGEKVCGYLIPINQANCIICKKVNIDLKGVYLYDTL